MTITLKFDDGTEHTISDVTYFAWDGYLFGCERIPDIADEKQPYPWSPAKSSFPAAVYPSSRIAQVLISVTNVTFQAETEMFFISRNVREIGFDVNSRMFLGKLSYAGKVMNFSANEY